MMAQTSGRQRVMAGITHGDGSGFVRFLKTGYVEVDTRRTQQTATRTDYDVIINVITARVPNQGHRLRHWHGGLDRRAV